VVANLGDVHNHLDCDRRRSEAVEDSGSDTRSQLPSPDTPIAPNAAATALGSSTHPGAASTTVQEHPVPMLDVHPPHAPSYTWKDFFIHLATITIGLLIAISLEQSVEAVHHRQEVRETRAALQEEHQENIKRFHRNVRSHLRALAQLHSNLRVYMYLRDHPGTPEAKLPGAVRWPLFEEEPVKAAWSTAERTNVLALMPAAEVRKFTADYFQLDYAWQLYQPVITVMARCTTYYTHTSDVSTLSPAELAQVIDCTEQAQSLQTIYGDQLSQIGENKDYAPVPSWWQMIPFFQMEESIKRAETNHEAYSQTMRDIDSALAADPAGPPKDH
jgi:hypothetical protein